MGSACPHPPAAPGHLFVRAPGNPASLPQAAAAVQRTCMAAACGRTAAAPPPPAVAALLHLIPHLPLPVPSRLPHRWAGRRRRRLTMRASTCWHVSSQAAWWQTPSSRRCTQPGASAAARFTARCARGCLCRSARATMRLALPCRLPFVLLFLGRTPPPRLPGPLLAQNPEPRVGRRWHAAVRRGCAARHHQNGHAQFSVRCASLSRHCSGPKGAWAHSMPCAAASHCSSPAAETCRPPSAARPCSARRMEWRGAGVPQPVDDGSAALLRWRRRPAGAASGGPGAARRRRLGRDHANRQQQV